MRRTSRLRLLFLLPAVAALVAGCGAAKDTARLVVKLHVPSPSARSGRWVASVEVAARTGDTTTGKRRLVTQRDPRVPDVFTLRGKAAYHLGVLVHRPHNSYFILGSCANDVQVPRNAQRAAIVSFDRSGRCTVRITNG